LTDKARIIERMMVAVNYADDKSSAWPDWKVRLVLKKIECLMVLMETTERRVASRV